MTSTLPEQLARLVRIRATEDREKPRANRWRYYAMFMNWLIFQIEADADFEAACELYRELAGMEEA